jgi:DNA invertase Pin-like site-specific DNA recombinase
MGRNTKYTETETCQQAVIFARVSSEEQEKQGSSIDAQLEALKRYCQESDLKVIKIFKPTESSTRGKRKEFHEMLDFIKGQKRKTAIIVHCIDRLQRSYKEYVELDRLREDDQIEMRFYKEGLILNKDSSSSDIMRWDMGILSAKMYIGAMKDNVKRSLKYNWSQGKWQGFAPVGYMNIKDENKKSKIILDPDRKDLVKRIFEEYATGLHTLSSLASLAKDIGLTSRQQKGGNTVSRAFLHQLLQNPFYYGIMRVKGQLMPHIYEPIIDRALFDIVQDVLKGKSRPPFKLGYKEIPYIFRGLIKCGTYGCTITPETHTKESRLKFTYLRCSHLKGPCNQQLVNENVILNQLNTEIFDNIHVPESMLAELKANVREYLLKERTSNKITKKNINTRLTELKTREESLFDFYLDGKCSKEWKMQQGKV